jgi:hypothetical protein
MNPREWPGRIWSRVRRPSRKGIVVMAAAVFLAVVSTAAAAAIISFSQSLPGTAPGSGPVAPDCTGTLSAFAGTQNVTFSCGGTLASAAIHVTTAATVVPTFGSLGVGDDSLWIFSSTDTAFSPGCIGQAITSGDSVTLQPGSYDYCIWANATTNDVTVSWASFS